MAQRYYAVIREHGEAWNAARGLREQRDWDEHAAFMDGLFEEGFVVLAGPLGNDAALLICAAADADEVRARLAPDPWGEEMLRLGRVEPWEVLLGAPATPS